MKKKLYFVVEKELDSTNKSLTGNNTIDVYEIIDNEPKKFASIDSVNSESSVDAIQDYLDDNGYGDEAFLIKQL